MSQTKVIRAEQDYSKHGIAHFISEQFLSSFLDGHLSLAHFTHFHSNVDDPTGRNDIDEGMISSADPNVDRLFIGIEEVAGVFAPASAMKELKFNSYKLKAHKDIGCHIFSCTLISPKKGEWHRKMEEGRRYIATFKKFREFRRLFENAIIDKDLSAKVDTLEYFDHGRVSDDSRIFFAKPLKYSYQKELRFAVFDYPSKERLKLEIGDIRSLVNIGDLQTRKWILY